VRRDAKVTLADILESCRLIEGYTAGMTLDAFTADQKTFDAVIRNLEVIGEAAKNLPEDVRAQIPDIDWRMTAGLRDVLIHNYFGIDAEIVWDVVIAKLPRLRERVFAFVSRL
jgi:uncharacterized protein with HEPN domain